MLVTLSEVLKDAKKRKYAVGMFNTVNIEMARGVIEAAEETKSPVIIGSAEILLPFCSLEELTSFLLPKAKAASVPVVLHFDHGFTEANIKKAIAMGFTSVMYDCSSLAFDENCKALSAMCEYAHSKGVSVEAELGHVGDNEGSMEGLNATETKSLFTDPKQATEYVEKTNCDALAVSIGNAHGAYKLPPKLDFNRLAELEEAVRVALVLHGGSGLSDDDFKKAIAGGIAKVNIFTDINMAGARAAGEAYAAGKKALTDLIPLVNEAIKSETIKKMQLFSSVGKA